MAVLATPTATVSRVDFRPATYGDVVRSEWTKLRSVQATYWCLLVGAVLAVGLGALVSRVGASRHQGQLIGWNPVDHSLRSLLIAQLAFAVLGVMTVTSEYSTGMIRTSLTAVPRRTEMMSAKLLVLTGVLLVAGQLTAFATFGLGQALIHGLAPSASLGQHLVFRAVLGAGLYLALLGLLAAGLAVLLRNAAAGIATIVALLFVLPGIVSALPSSWSNPIEEWWPTNAGQQVAFTIRDSHTLPAWIGFGWMALFTAVVIGVAFFWLERRDA